MIDDLGLMIEMQTVFQSSIPNHQSSISFWPVPARGLARVILLAFFFPLALYLLVLGLVNRQRFPLLISGVWDGIGLLCGASGFLLFAGPAVLSGLSERWRLYWLLGKGDMPFSGPDGGRLWVFLSLVYFVLIVGTAVFYLRRQRPLTAIYNADAAQVAYALAHSCTQLGLQPVRSGDLFLFGFAADESTAIQTHVAESKPISLLAPQARTAVLELESFPLMRHVTLRWDPGHTPLRPLVERELAQQLAELPSDSSLLGGWLLTLGFLLLSFELAGSLLIVFLNLTAR
jgi:hypothetical protein